MVKEVRWTQEAEVTFERVIDYLRENWTDKEIQHFLEATINVIEQISIHPKMYRKSSKSKAREALITPHNLLIYIEYRKHINLITFFDTRQHPKKKKF